MLKPECPLLIPISHEVGPKVSHDCDIPVWKNCQKILEDWIQLAGFPISNLSPCFTLKTTLLNQWEPGAAARFSDGHSGGRSTQAILHFIVI